MNSSTIPELSPEQHVERRGSGFPILLLHGWGASSALFAQTMLRMENSYTLIAPDFPGFGATPPPPAAWSVGDYVDWVIKLLDSLHMDRVHIIGHSFGGRVAIKLASQHPDRVCKLVLTDSAGIRPNRTLLYWIRVRRYKALQWVAKRSWMVPAIRQWAKAWSTAQGSSDFQQTAGTLRSTFVRVVNEDLREFLPQIKAPTLLIWGDRDEETPLSDGQLMEKLIPDAGLIVFEGSGHYAYLEQHDRFCHIVQTFFDGA